MLYQLVNILDVTANYSFRDHTEISLKMPKEISLFSLQNVFLLSCILPQGESPLTTIICCLRHFLYFSLLHTQILSILLIISVAYLLIFSLSPLSLPYFFFLPFSNPSMLRTAAGIIFLTYIVT